jgi:hypothetical protein
MKTLIATIAVAVIFTASVGRADDTRACVDAAGHAAVCYDDPGTWHECRASGAFGRCPKDPACYGDGGEQTRCVGKVVLATARCADGSATASPTPEQTCTVHGGISARY